jgi:hypothetical protein
MSPRVIKNLKETTMSAFSHPIVIVAPAIRSLAFTALMGATMLAMPLSARAADNTAPSAQAAATPAPSAAAMKAETVEERIATLHEDLKITPAEEADWDKVAKVMRDNDAAMQKLVAEKTAKDRDSMTAVEDLQTYEKFARAHVEGLKSLTSSFDTLYKSMPETQRKVADEVFRSAGHAAASSHG